MPKVMSIVVLATLFFAGSADASDKSCVHVSHAHASQDGQMLQAMVELWWAKKKLPMRQIPDHVSFERYTAKTYAVRFLRQGCAVASLEVPNRALEKFLLKRLGPEA